MAAVVQEITLSSTGNSQTYATTAFNFALGDLGIVACVVTATATITGVTDSNADGLGVYTQVAAGTKASSADAIQVWARDAFAGNTGTTGVTVSCIGDAGTGAEVEVMSITGMSRVGAASVRQVKVASNQSAGTPAVTFDAAALTGNVIIAAVANATTPAGITEPSGFTERADIGNSSPDCGLEVATVNSGFTGTTITWGGASASDFGAIIVELDTSVPVTGGPKKLLSLGVG